MFEQFLLNLYVVNNEKRVNFHEELFHFLGLKLIDKNFIKKKIFITYLIFLIFSINSFSFNSFIFLDSIGNCSRFSVNKHSKSQSIRRIRSLNRCFILDILFKKKKG
jgi:hypothetical protein